MAPPHLEHDYRSLWGGERTIGQRTFNQSRKGPGTGHGDILFFANLTRPTVDCYLYIYI